MRDDFPKHIKEVLAKRVGYLCSNPTCMKLTSGPNSLPDKAINIGVAAHISAASERGPRYNPKLSKEERGGIENGIWLCQNCATLIDRDKEKYTVPILLSWKKTAEEKAEKQLLSNQGHFERKIIFDGILFGSVLEARWAYLFKGLNWEYAYRPFESAHWNPTFSIITETEQKYLVDVGKRADFDLNKRNLIGIATNYSKNILAVFEDPFRQNFGDYRNIIGMSSLEGKTRNSLGNEDFEFCTCVVSRGLWVSGIDIFNLCELEPEWFDTIEKEEEFCLEIWKRAVNEL